MQKQALVVGSETSPLLGVNRDAGRMAASFAALGFAVDLRTGVAASRAGILDGYLRMIRDATPGSAAVVYYSGHGSLETAPVAAADGPFARRRYQAIVPTDYHESTAEDFRGILAEELSVLLWKLVQKTPNVAVIFDCCHAALMSRGPQVRAKALPQPAHVGVVSCIEKLLASETPAVLAAALAPRGSAVPRLVACRQEESAYEYVGADGLHCGVFSEGLLLALDEARGLSATWRQLAARATEHVRLRFPGQLPGVEGAADRRLFTTDELVAEDTAPVVDTVEEGWVVRRGQLAGVRPGDVYSIRPAVGDQELARGTVISVGIASARLSLPPALTMSLPEGARGVPIEWAEAPRRVFVPADSEQREVIVAAIAATRRISVTDDAIEPVIATVAQNQGRLSLHNRDGLPLRDPSDPFSLAQLQDALRTIARASALRDLHGFGDLAPTALAVEWGLVIGGRTEPLPLAGATVGPGDGIYFRLRNTGDVVRFVHLFNIGVAERITLMTESLSRSGIRLEPGEEQVLPRDRLTGAVVPLPFHWPTGVPTAQGLRADEFLIVATEHAVDLGSLAQTGTRGEPGLPRGRSPLRQLLEQVSAGATRDFGGFGGPPVDGFLTRRITLWASPFPVPRAEACFQIDDQPPMVALTAQPRRSAPPPQKLAVVLRELIVHNNRALFGADIRVDALFVTPPGRSQQRAYHAGTICFPNVHDGDRLPLDQVLLYMGPARDFLQLCFWVSRDTAGAHKLGDMLDSAAQSKDVQQALGALAGLVAAAPQAALAVSAVGAAITLTNVAYKLLTAAVGRTVGVYRTSLLAADDFRLGSHPREGLIRAQDFSFSFEVRQIP